MSSGWGPPPSLQRMASSPASSALYPQHIGPSPTSMPPSSSASALTTQSGGPHPPPFPPIRALTGYEGADDDHDEDGEEDDEEDDNEDEDEDEEGEDDASLPEDSMAASKKRKRKDSGTTDTQNPAASSAAGPSTSTSHSQNAGQVSSSSTSLLAEDEPREKKPKVSRGSKACTNCRRLKMRCVPSTNEGGHPCKRCLNSGGSCVFEVSQRGKRTSKGKRTEAMAASLKKMEETLNSVLRSIRDPAGSGGGNVDLAPSNSMGSDFANAIGATNDLPRSPFDQFAPSTSRVTSAPVASGRLAPGASPGGQHINPASIITAAAAAAAGAGAAVGVAPGAHSSSRSSHGGSQAAGLSPDQERTAGGDSGSGNASATYDRSRPADASSTSGSSQHHDSHPHHHNHHPQQRLPSKSSPRLHSLPDNSLNPLGLLAEASLHNTERASRRAAAAIHHRRGTSFTSSREGLLDDDAGEVGISPAAISERSAPGGESSQAGATAGAAGEDGTPRGRSGTGGAADSGGLGKKADGKARAMSSAGVGGGSTATATSAAAAHADKGDNAVHGDEDTTNLPRFVRPEGDLSHALGVASSSYFKPGPLSNLPLRRVIIEREVPPQLLTQGIISSEEILDLFQIYFHYCATHVLLLDPDMHTPALICARSPFLFSAVCCVASRYYSHKRPDLYAKCLAEAKRCAFDIMHRGYKSVEIVQGFLLLSMWNQPSERYETDKTWLFSGVAMRMATDLNLHRKSVLTLPPDMSPNDPIVLEREREILNRERTWYVCFSIDRALSAQMGKPYTIREDFLTRNCKYWCEQRVSQPWDLALSALVDLLRLTSRMLDMLYSSTRSVNGLNMELDYSTMLRIWNEQLDELRDQLSYKGVFPASFRPHSDPFREIKTRIAAQRAHISLGSPSVRSAGGGRAGSAAQGAGGADAAPAAAGAARENGTRRPSEKGSASRDEEGDTDDDAGGAGDKQQQQKQPQPGASASEGMQHHQRILHFCVQQAPLRWHNAVLIINSFGLQRALDLGSDDKNYFFIKCLTAAKGMLEAAMTGLRPVLRYAPDAQFVMISYACVFLLKLLRKEFRGWIDEEEVLSLISGVIDLLDEVAVNETHTPALNATFLRRLLNARAETRPGSPYASVYPSRAGTPPASAAAAAGAGGAAGGGHRPDAALAMTGLDSGGSNARAGTGTKAGTGRDVSAGPASGLTDGVAHGTFSTNNGGGNAGLAGGGGVASGTADSGQTFSNLSSLLGGGGPALTGPAASSTGPGGSSSGQQQYARFAAGFSPNIVSASSFGDEHGHGHGHGQLNTGMGGMNMLSGEVSASLNVPFSSADGGGLGAGLFSWAGGLGGGGGGGIGGGDANQQLLGLDNAPAAAFGVSSLAQLFPSNMGFSGTGAPADSSHAAAMHVSSAPSGAGSGSAGVSGSMSGTQGGASGSHHNGGGLQQHHHHHGAVNAGLHNGQATTMTTNNNHSLTESVFDDNFWSTLLPPGFGTSSSLSGSGWDFAGGGGGSTGLNMGFGMGMGMGMGMGGWPSGPGGGGSGGSGGLGMNVPSPLNGGGEDGAPAGAGAGSASKAGGSRASAGAGASGTGNGNGSAGGTGQRQETPSAVGAFNF
ncbi:unnamed protein product [Tilletia controversa]|nr:unnamed protein product [Tilletia controversa]